MFYALNVLTSLNIMMMYPKLFSLSPSSPSGDEVCSLLVPGVPGWCRPSLAGWASSRAAQLSWLSVLPGPPQSAHHTDSDTDTGDTSDSDFSLLGATQGGIQVTGACKWYETSFSRVDTMLNGLTRRIISLSYIYRVVCKAWIFKWEICLMTLTD